MIANISGRKQYVVKRKTVVFPVHVYLIWWTLVHSSKNHRRRSSVNFKGPDMMYEKLTKCPNFTWFLPEKNQKNTRIFIIFFRKINKISEFYTIFATNMPEFYIIIGRKIFFPNFRGGARVPPLPSPFPTPMAKIGPEFWATYNALALRIGHVSYIESKPYSIDLSSCKWASNYLE